VIIGDGENLGVISKSEALKEALNRDLDLVLISADANPPVAKIMDFKKFLYEQSKKAKQSKAGSRRSAVKEIRFSPSIEDGDLATKVNRSREFLERGDKVKVTVRMRGREAAHPENAFDKIKIMEQGLKEVAKLEGELKKIGKKIFATFVRK